MVNIKKVKFKSRKHLFSSETDRVTKSFSQTLLRPLIVIL